MAKMKSLLLALVLVFALDAPAYGCIGGRAFGMGYAQVACPNDSTAAYWNPAFLPLVPDSVEMGIVYWDADIVAYAACTTGNFGLVSVQDREGTYEYVVLSYGWQVNENLYFGASLGNLMQFSFAYFQSNLTYALLIQDGHFRPSIAVSLQDTTFALEIYDLFNQMDFRQYRLGIEHKTNNIFLRCGVATWGNGINETNYYYGMGFIKNNFNIDLSTRIGGKSYLSIGYRY